MDPTPGQMPSIYRRLACMLYESLLVLGVLSITFMVPHLALGMGLKLVLPGWILVLHVFIVLGGYFIWYWSHGGQTLAMQTWKIQLIRADGAHPTLARLLVRYTLAWPSLIYFGVGLIWALFDRDRQFLHDRLAGTRLVFKQA